MKKIFYLLALTLVVVSCKKDVNYATFSGKITNKNADSLVVFDPSTNFNQTIKVAADGSFSEELIIENGLFSITDGTEYSLIYLEKGAKLTMNLNAANFLESVNYSGTHVGENNFLAGSVVNEEALLADTSLMNLPKTDFDTRIKKYATDFKERLKKNNLTSNFITSQELEIADLENYYNKQYEEKNYLTLKLGKGVASPLFADYENYKGGTTSLSDLKGKYVYIDLWATWCPPCKYEIPFLQKIETAYHDKNIAFVSISIDAAKDYETWRNMVEVKNLSGVQLYAKGDTQFTSAYRVTTIPRFILLDKTGNIINANAPRPSKPELTTLLNSLEL